MVRCRNPNLGPATKTKACKGVGQEWSLGITFHAPRNVGECEGMNPHIPKWIPILGVRVLMDSQIFKGWLQSSKLTGLKSSLYH
jgi:hypothetical protein